MRFYLLKDEKGIAMVVVLGIMLILTVLAFATMAVSENDLVSSSHDKESMEALHIAEAGVQKSLWQLEKYGNAMSPKTFSINVGNGTANVNAIQSGSDQWYWTIESTGTCGTAHRKLKVTVFNFSIWNMNMALGSNKSLATGGNGILGTTSIDGPFYVRGNVELSGNSSITTGPLFIKQGSLVFLNNSATLGTQSVPVSAYIEPVGSNGDIVDKNGGLILSNPNQNQVFLSSLSNQVPDIQLPPIDSMASYRQQAALESTETPAPSTYHDTQVSVDPAVSGGYKVLDDDGAIATGNKSLRHTYHFDSSVSDFGTTTCGLAWIGHKLYVNGTVYVDGNLVIGDGLNDEVLYTGNGTLIVNGEIKINGKLRADTATHNMDGTHALGLVSNDEIEIDIHGSNIADKNNPDVTGAFYATKEIEIEQNNTTFVGSMIAGTLDFASGTNNSHLFTDDSLPTFLPPSLPGSTSFLAMTTSWREVN